MRLLAVAALTLLTSCGGAQAEPAKARPTAPLVSAGATVKSWGATLREWKVNASGAVEHVSGDRAGANRTDVIIETRRFTLTPVQMQALAAAVARVETILKQPEQCAQKLTDGPYGSFSWDRGAGEHSLRFDGNCVDGRDYELVSAVFAADKVIDEAAKSVEPAERRPLTADH